MALAPHAHPWGQLIYSITEVMTVWTERGPWVALPQWAVWAPAGVAHAIRFTGSASMRTLYLRPGLVRLGETSAVVPVTSLLRELVLRAVALQFLDERDRGQASMAELIVAELRTQPTAALALPMPRSGALRRVAEYVTEAPGELDGQAEMARRLGMGRRTSEAGIRGGDGTFVRPMEAAGTVLAWAAESGGGRPGEAGGAGARVRERQRVYRGRDFQAGGLNSPAESPRR